MPYAQWQWIEPVKDALLGIAAAVTAVVAVFGIRSWHRELTGKAEFEVARALIRATYKVREAIRACRSPFVLGIEFPQSYQERHFDKKSDLEEAQGYAYVYRNRLAPVFNALQDFDASALEAEVLWGSEVPSKTNVLRQCISELQAAIEATVDDKMHGGADFTTDREFGKKMRSVISWSPSESKNAFSLETAAAIVGIEAVVRPHMRHRRTEPSA